MTNQLHVLKVEIDDHPLLQAHTALSLVATQRVSVDEADALTHLFGRIWVNRTTALIGRNAAGKSMIMRLSLGALALLFENRSITQTQLQDAIFGKQAVTFTVNMYGDDGYLIEDRFVIDHDPKSANVLFVRGEVIRQRRAKQSETRKSIFEFTDDDIVIDRNELSDRERMLLASDDSVMRMILNEHAYVAPTIVDTLFFTDMNVLMYPSAAEVPEALLTYLDPSIEYLRIERSDKGKAAFRLKFKGTKPEDEITESNFGLISNYLSSGTAKAITLYQLMLHALKTGGMIMIDEIENHFHQEIVNNFVDFFSNPLINVNNATLIFSTHYAEMIDNFERGDQIYVVRREDQIALQRYSDLADRADLKRSEVFTSNYLTGTAPDYDAYMALRKATIAQASQWPMI